jgi:hypothetical protein
MLPRFDELVRLASQEPEKLETLRQGWVENTISRAPEPFQRRLRGLQFQIDMEREKASNPISSCVRISQMMHEGLANLRESLNQHDNEKLKEESVLSAAVLPFPLSITDKTF